MKYKKFILIAIGVVVLGTVAFATKPNTNKELKDVNISIEKNIHSNIWNREGITTNDQQKDVEPLRTEETKELQIDIGVEPEDLPDNIGKKVKGTLKDIEGKYVIDVEKGKHLLYIGSTWCPYCVASNSAIRDFEDSTGIKVIRVSSEEKQDLYNYSKGAYRYFQPSDNLIGKTKDKGENDNYDNLIEVKFVPTFVVIEDGVVKDELVAVPSVKNLRDMYGLPEDTTNTEETK